MSVAGSSMEKTSTWYTRIAGMYDLLAWRSERAAICTGVRLLEVKPGETVLEIGYGTGHAVIALAQAVGPGKVYGIDISEGMYRIAQAAVVREGCSDRVTLTRGDARRLPFADHFFDAVFLSFTLELFSADDRIRLLRECGRVLVGEGRLCVVALEKTASPGIAERGYEVLHRIFPQYLDCRPIMLAAAVEQAGFRITGSRTLSMWGLPVKIVTGTRVR
jgi:ubiquinone/menaquinone biosynthesis C-methylase UbiE